MHGDSYARWVHRENTNREFLHIRCAGAALGACILLSPFVESSNIHYGKFLVKLSLSLSLPLSLSLSRTLRKRLRFDICYRCNVIKYVVRNENGSSNVRRENARNSEPFSCRAGLVHERGRERERGERKRERGIEEREREYRQRVCPGFSFVKHSGGFGLLAENGHTLSAAVTVHKAKKKLLKISKKRVSKY
jgi:hypothetical protein